MTDLLANEDVYSATRAEQLLFTLERTHGISRRELVKLGTIGIAVLAGAAKLASPQAARAARADNGSPISKPLPANWFINYGSNAEMIWASVPGLGYSIPTERFFVRDHTGTPIIGLSSWQLSVYGTGLKGSPTSANPVTFNYDELRALPAKTIYTSIECAGNARSFFATQEGTPAAGTQWTLGAIGVAAWTGVPLSTVLGKAGIVSTAIDVMPIGLDENVVANGVDAGNVRRPIPVSKALDDPLLAYEMNGQPLPYDHGFPLRLVGPGWVGVANIKWVGQIDVSTTPQTSLWNTSQYILEGASLPTPVVVTTQVVKSAFELPFGAQFPVGQQQILAGRSWSGNGAIRRVDISVDNGVTWTAATLHGANIPNAWARWNFTWTPELAGNYTLQARATDSTGQMQPTTVPFNTLGYLFGAIVQHPVAVA